MDTITEPAWDIIFPGYFQTNCLPGCWIQYMQSSDGDMKVIHTHPNSTFPNGVEKIVITL